MAKYSSKEFKELFETFSKMFEQEGDIYLTTKKSVESDYDHASIPSEMSKRVVLTILKDAAVDFYKKNTEVLTEEIYIKKYLS